MPAMTRQDLDSALRQAVILGTLAVLLILFHRLEKS